jgi:DNA invertase Pin-like site-specific DNA recombinase
MKIGYTRVSTKDQDLRLQLDALERAGCEDVYKEKASGAKRERPELQRMLDQLRVNDVVIIWKLDRLARSLKDLIELVNLIQDKGAGLQSLNDHIDTTPPHGKLTFHIFAAIAEFERDIISERTLAGLASARARGRVGGGQKASPRKPNIPPSSPSSYIRKAS